MLCELVATFMRIFNATLENPVSLYLLTIADSGERKSTCDKHFMRIINEHDREQAELFKPDKKTYRADLSAWEAKVAGIKAKIQEATKKGADTRAHENDLRGLEHDKPQEPRIPRLVYSDTTPEALARDLATKWPVNQRPILSTFQRPILSTFSAR